MPGYTDNYTKLTHMVRQTLLRQFNEQDIALQNFYCREEGLALFLKMTAQRETSGYIHRKRELISHLQKAGIVCSLQDSEASIKECVDLLPVADEMERRLMDILYGIYKKALSPSRQIEQLVRKLGVPAYQNGSVRLAIVKQFIANTTWHTRAVTDLIRAKYLASEDITDSDLKKRLTDSDLKKPEVLAELADESIFDVLSGKLTKDEKRRYTLLRLADDLASGRFRSNGGTRTALYMFAFAFEMSVYLDPEKDRYDPDRDIEKNLFFDYYSNSLLRFISEDYVKHSSDYEAEPIGEGINYKNFAEAIYLYCLSRTDLTAAERLRHAETLIDECVSYAAEHECGMGYEDGLGFSMSRRYTYLYRDLYLLKIRSMPEEELVEFICDYYDIGAKQSSTTRISVASDALTAAFHFEKGLSEIAGRSAYSASVSETIAQSLKEQMTALCTAYGDRQFTTLINRMCDMLYESYAPSDRNVSRTRMLVLAFEEFMNTQELTGLSMSELYRHFTGKINPKLKDSRYQPICPGNIFDMFVILLLYRNLNIL